MFTEILRWWLVIQGLGILALPLTGLLFRSLPDCGYAFSKSLGLLLTGYGAWLLAMLGLGSFSAPLLLCVALLMAAAGLALPAPPGETGARLQRLRPAISWRALLVYETLFLLAFIALALLRSRDMGFVGPHPWGTERPMDFAFFNAIQRSAGFPPADPWLAGFSINYYYLGYLLMAVVALLSGIDGATAYNLALALIFALTAIGVAGVIANLMALANRREAAENGSSRRWPRFTPLLALLGVVFVLLAGNLSGALQIFFNDHRVVALDSRQLLTAGSQALAGAEEIRLPYPARTSDFGTFETLGTAEEGFNWWWPSRALWDAYPAEDGPVRRYNITEFPYFSFWLGDMHPHVMALPFGLLAMALSLSLQARPALPDFLANWRGRSELILSAIVLGSLYLINSWDLPTYLLLYAGALLLLFLRSPAAGWRELSRLGGALLLAIALLFAPFFLTFRSLVGGGGEPLIDLPLLGSLTRAIAPYAASRSDLAQYLLIYGMFLLPLIAFVYLMLRPGSQPAGDQTGLLAGSGSQAAQLRPGVLLPWLPPLLLLIGLLIGFPLLALFGLGLMAALLAVRRRHAPADAFGLLLVALGCAIFFGVELIYIRDVFGNRMNTVFKFYYQTWLLWGTLAPYALWRILALSRGSWRVTAYLTNSLTLILLAAALVYPVQTLRELAAESSAYGLEGRTPREQTADGRAAIEWLRANAPPGSVVLEMVAPGGGSYNGEGYAGVSAATGLPTVLGWVGHQQQWRGGDPVALAELEPRRSNVDEIYFSLDLDRTRELLDRYDVDYVYVGELERRNYAPESLAKFAELGTPVFSEGEVTIYRIRE
jgi:YYY domain-containing protein